MIDFAWDADTDAELWKSQLTTCSERKTTYISNASYTLQLILNPHSSPYRNTVYHQSCQNDLVTCKSYYFYQQANPELTNNHLPFQAVQNIPSEKLWDYLDGQYTAAQYNLSTSAGHCASVRMPRILSGFALRRNWLPCLSSSGATSEDNERDHLIGRIPKSFTGLSNETGFNKTSIKCHLLLIYIAFQNSIFGNSVMVYFKNVLKVVQS